MNNAYIDPIYLPIVPPMDLNRNMTGIDRISPFPMRLRTRSSVGLFGTRRGGDAGHIRMHQAVDLLAPIGTPVFAAATGKVIGGSSSSALILHDMGFKFLTFYQHMQNKSVATDDEVVTGQQLGEVADFGGPSNSEDHLHFEIRYPFDAADPSRKNSLPIDPTNALYQWEVKTFQNDTDARRGHIFDNVSITNLEEVWRGRLLRFLLINISGNTRDLFVPFVDASPANLSMVETLKLAFFHSKRVRIVWRESLFFSTIQSTFDKASIIAEVKALN